jgi:hypothetical protein
MSFDFNELLRKQLYALQDELGLSNFNIEVDEEQSFLKNKNLLPNTIYVLTKKLQNNIEFGVDNQPIQMLVLSEQNSIEKTKLLFKTYANRYNWQMYIEDDTLVKQQYSEPVVLSNFNTVAYGYRTVLYMSVYLNIMTNVVDLKDLTIDDESVDAINFNISYATSLNTQQFDTDFIAKSVKSVTTMSITITIPVISSNLITKVLNILNESDTESTDPLDVTSYGGNENFYFQFKLGNFQFNKKAFKLTSADYGTAINNAPTIRLSFLR